LNFNQSFEKGAFGGIRTMSQGKAVPRTAIVAQTSPVLVRLMGKFVLEVLPAAMASVIGGLLLAQYQLGHPSAGGPAVESSARASAEMVRMVQDEHAMIRDFLLAQSAAEKRRLAAADAADAGAAEDAELAAAALRRSASAPAKPVLLPASAHGRANVVAATAEVAPQGPLVIAQPIEVTAPPASPFAPPAPIAPPPPPVASGNSSLVATTLAIPGHVVGAALHAVSVIGGIPSWIGNRLGSTPS
jgi:hypothetical protein